jgi:hypothetical protein
MNIQERTTEIIKIFKQLKGLNLGIMGFDEFTDFRKICNQFIKDGQSVKGQIPIGGTQRVICYQFGKKVSCVLKYDSEV